MASTAAAAALSDSERRALERLIASLRRNLGDDLHAVWLYGSRARGEWRWESDIDVLVIAETRDSVRNLVDAAASGEDLYPGWFSVTVHTPEWVADRRAIAAWFMQEVDRDKIVLWGGEAEPPADFTPREEAGPVRQRTRDYLQSAHSMLDDARELASLGSARGALSDAYYAVLNAAEAVLSEADRHVRSHAGRWHLVRELTVDAGALEEELHAAAAALQARRELADYGPRRPEDPFPVFTAEEAKAAVATAEHYLRAVEALLGAR
jgi:predicted nucleotidyltransferase/uncharacterized protein (UPF0332 family)